ncbi:mitochondrial ribosomal protein S18B [Rhinolophus ferrumequinum]|uniref:Small ribosomal subunit protein mS40 n=1 Tax=Rhinolophus ferrumequinum TaxID=59479 RepID=A0A7J7YSY7_RHIFE|nr:mitochondrial ribosomal protein S18B [Rhinolophus ferrumequinum]
MCSVKRWGQNWDMKEGSIWRDGLGSSVGIVHIQSLKVLVLSPLSLISPLFPPQNVKLLEQFVCAHTGIIFHAPYTGVCMNQHKKLTQAIQKARDHGLLSYHIPQVEPRDLDFSNSHGAVSVTPPAPTLLSGDPWYPWYNWKQPPESELSRLRRLYRGHLREESGPAPESVPEVPPTSRAEAAPVQAGAGGPSERSVGAVDREGRLRG